MTGIDLNNELKKSMSESGWQWFEIDFSGPENEKLDSFAFWLHNYVVEHEVTDNMVAYQTTKKGSEKRVYIFTNAISLIDSIRDTGYFTQLCDDPQDHGIKLVGLVTGPWSKTEESD